MKFCTTQFHRALTLLLTVAMLLSAFAFPALAAQDDTYHDPAEEWMSSANRTNELDINAVLTEETNFCAICQRYTKFTIWRTPEYTRDGQTALTRNVMYSDGTMIGGVGQGSILDGKPGVDAYYTGYHWNKSVCEVCGEFNTNEDVTQYDFTKNVYVLFDCDVSFTGHLPETVRYEYADGAYHTKITEGGSYCEFCFGTKHTHTSALERHTTNRAVEPQIGHNRFVVSDHCALCEYEAVSYVTAKTVVADYYGVVDGQAHTLSLTDLSDTGVSTSIRYGNSAASCTMTTAPSYTTEGQYAVYYAVTYTYGGESMTENGVAYVWLRDESLGECACACGDPDCGCANRSCNGNCHSSSCGTEHRFAKLDTVAPTCTSLGYDRYVCADCGFVEKRNYTNALGHAYGGVTVSEASCRYEGKVLEICTRCSDVKVTTTLKGAHKYTTYSIAATCTSPGYTVRECSVCGERSISNITSITEHKYTTINIPSTCVDGGKITKVCADCGHVGSVNYIPASGHSWDDGKTLTKASCMAEGVIVYGCKNCTAETYETIPATGHTHGKAATCTSPELCTVCGAVIEDAHGHHFKSAVTPATCLKMGYTTYTCSDCGDSYKSDYTDPLGHNYIGVVTPPTCLEDGYTTYTCSRCGDSYIDDHVEALGHNWDAGREVVNSTCNGKGMIEHRCTRCNEIYLESVSEAGHRKGAAATCTTPQVCLDCDAVLVHPLGHSYRAIVTPATCDSRGYTTYSCIRCDKTFVADYTDMLDHSYKATITPPTCTEHGYTTYTCPRCGDSYTDNYTEPTAHHWDRGTVISEASCVSDGVTVYRCHDCDAGYIMTTPAYQHTPGKAATCTTPQLCTTCGAVLDAAHDHNWGRAVTPATCLKMGYTTYTCEDCGKSYKSDYTEAIGHNYVALVTSPNCTEGGYATYTCVNCGDSYQDDFTEANGHRLDTGTALTPGICEHAGIVQYKCLDCDYSELRTLEATGHTPGPAATCTEPQVCTVCGKELAPATGHTVGDWIVDKEATTGAEGSRHKECEVCHEVFETETLEKLYLTATTDTHGEAIVGDYLVTVTDTNSGDPIANATLVLNKDGTISVKLPDGRLLDYAAQVTVTVQKNEDQSAVPGLTLTVTDSNGNTVTDQTNGNGQLTVPTVAAATDSDGKTTLGHENDDGERKTLTVLLRHEDTGRPITGAGITVSRKGALVITLPEGVDLDEAHRIVVTVLNEIKKPVVGMEVTVRNDLNRSADGITDAAGEIVVPEIIVTETARHGAYIDGYPDGAFGPERGMTRAEAATIFARLLAQVNGDTINTGAYTKFADVPSDAWYSGYVKHLAGAGVITGVAGDAFEPEREITRAEFVALAVRFFDAYGGIVDSDAMHDTAFPDVTRVDWAVDYIREAAANGWIEGYEDGSFRPENTITRAEVVTVVNRLLGRVADETYITKNIRYLNTFADMSTAHWAYFDVMEAANAHTAVFDGGETWEK